jgi:hypothetical protein
VTKLSLGKGGHGPPTLENYLNIANSYRVYLIKRWLDQANVVSFFTWLRWPDPAFSSSDPSTGGSLPLPSMRQSPPPPSTRASPHPPLPSTLHRLPPDSTFSSLVHQHFQWVHRRGLGWKMCQGNLQTILGLGLCCVQFGCAAITFIIMITVDFMTVPSFRLVFFLFPKYYAAFSSFNVMRMRDVLLKHQD